MRLVTTGTVSTYVTVHAPPRRLRSRIAFWILAAVALLASHDAVFLVQLGPGEGLVRALRSGGHDYWGTTSLVLVAVGMVAGTASFVRLAVLRHQARGLSAVTSASDRGFVRRLVVGWSRLFAVVALGFVLQENAEHLAMHSHAIGLGALIGPEYPLAAPVIGVITLIGALAATLIVGSAEALLVTIAAALAQPPERAPRRIARPPLALVPPRLSPLARCTAGRAPPPAPASAS